MMRRLLSIAAGTVALACNVPTGPAPTAHAEDPLDLVVNKAVISGSGSSLHIGAEVLGGVACSHQTGSQAPDSTLFWYPTEPPPGEEDQGRDSVYMGVNDLLQTQTGCELTDAGWVWPVITNGYQTDYRPRLDITLVSESYGDVPSPGSVQLTAQSNECDAIGWRVPGDTIMPSTTLSFSVSPSTSYSFLAVFECDDSGGPLFREIEPRER